MATLVCEEEMLRELLAKRVISIKLEGDNLNKMLKVKSPITEEIFEIEIVADTKHIKQPVSDEKDTIVEELNTDNFTLNQWWDRFLNRVPSNIEHGVWTKSNVNTGKRILKSNKLGEGLFKLNIEVNAISPSSMLMAYAYDLYSHRVSSKEDNNLKFMLSLDNWLANTHRIEVLFKEACKDIDFIEFYAEDPVKVEQGIRSFSPFNSLNSSDTSTDEYDF
jgi:protease II